MAPLEPWEKVLIDPEVFLDTVHGQIACTDCHDGVDDADKETAHEGLVARPSENSQEACGDCHSYVTENFAASLHASQEGYFTMFAARDIPVDHPATEEMFDNHCASCHTSCGDCHVSQPESVGGGLIDNHVFNATPSLTRNCTACHGSRVGNEYMGKHEDILADVHFRQGRMSCVSCHTANEMHGINVMDESAEMPADHRYSGEESPSCTSCHPDVAGGEDGQVMHIMHSENLSCQVCHSVSYTSCDGCHVQVDEESGIPYYATESSYMTFYIGKNPRQSESRPYDYVVLRHVPVSSDSFTYYGEELTANIDASPTWTYATPHNIQLNTPQNESCSACHGNTDIFLTADKVADGELVSNEPVIVEEVPGLDLLGQ